MKVIVGITGGISSGKSTISNYLIKNGYFVIDADEISHKITEKGNAALEKIREAFGNDVFTLSNELNRQALGNKIFADEQKRKELNDIIHPVVLNEIKNIISSSSEELIFIDVPLLFEAKYNEICDYTIVVYVDYDIQIDRLCKRNNISVSDAKIRIEAQMPLSEKIKLADYVINNASTEEESYNQLEKIINQIKEK